jgi:hypothetical protein
VLLDGLQFANGVALAPDGRSVLVAQTGRYDVLRYWLRGERAGTHEVFIDNLPGIPDGLSSNGRDTYWLALFTVRNPALDALSGWPRLRKVVFRLPEFLQPQPVRHAFVLGLSLDGEVLHNLQHPGADSFAPVTSATEATAGCTSAAWSQDAFGVLDLSCASAALAANESSEHALAPQHEQQAPPRAAIRNSQVFQGRFFSA